MAPANQVFSYVYLNLKWWLQNLYKLFPYTGFYRINLLLQG